MNPSLNAWEKLKAEVIDAGICTHCGTCVGLSSGALEIEETPRGPKPVLKKNTSSSIPEMAHEFCPGRGISYRTLNRHVFHHDVEDFTLGQYRRGFVGHAVNDEIRRAGASGGVITAALLCLLKAGRIKGAIVLKQGEPKPWLAKPIIATTEAEIRAASQSVYIPVMTNAILAELATFGGPVAYVGLPDQVAAIRALQAAGHLDALKIQYILGPYVGTGIYLEAIASFLRSNGVNNLEEICHLKYRDGEWPGHLRIDLKDGRSFKAAKFYYNYLIPFYVTTASLLAVDFSNELTDISVGDAWNPAYEKQGFGFSVVLGRSEKGLALLEDMKSAGLLNLEVKEHMELVNMHAHMIDFKKRGSFIRMGWMKRLGKRVPVYDYAPARIGFSRYIVEIVISGLFALGRFRLIRRTAECLPQNFLGKTFNLLRMAWKRISKSSKRKGIASIPFKNLELPEKS